MSEWLNRVFSGGVSLARVNPAGLAVMALSVVLIIAAKPVSRRVPEGRREGAVSLIKLGGLIVCAFGAAVSIL
ncbi:MAG: hypothetical protein IJO98_02550 [Clostridia bacterium]|nr:hypothetical protein [Clostridia bacterium]